MGVLQNFYLQKFSDNCRAHEIYEDVLIGKILSRHSIYPTEVSSVGTTCQFGQSNLTPDCLTVIDVTPDGLERVFHDVVGTYRQADKNSRKIIQRGTFRPREVSSQSTTPLDAGQFLGCAKYGQN